VQFLSNARGSCGEVRAQLYAALDGQYLTEDEFRVLCQLSEEVGRMISGLMAYLKTSEHRGRKFKE
jgi:four helix bundle protein